MHSWGILWTMRYKETKTPTVTSKELGTKTGYCACPLHAPPPQVGRHLSHPSGLTPEHTLPSLHKRGKLVPSPASTSWQTRESVVCSCSPLLQQGPQ